jgi:hypothetical protein
MGPHCFNTGTPKQIQTFSIWLVREQDNEANQWFVEAPVVVQLSDRLA